MTYCWRKVDGDFWTHGAVLLPGRFQYQTTLGCPCATANLDSCPEINRKKTLIQSTMLYVHVSIFFSSNISHETYIWSYCDHRHWSNVSRSSPFFFYGEEGSRLWVKANEINGHLISSILSNEIQIKQSDML